jgi:choline dehydrogenase-like flavoprotein
VSANVLDDDADYVIVGTGAGGATAARVLSDAGLQVIMLEEGPALRPEERPRALLDAMALSTRDFGTLSTSGSAPFPLLQGRCVGGSTAINSGIIWRMPPGVQRDWSERFGLGELVEERALQRIFELLEAELHVAEVAEGVRGHNARLLQRGSEALGVPGRPIRRNAKRCEGSARCLQGCPNGARQSMDVSYVPRALARGARLYAQARASRIRVKDGRAVGVEGELLDAERRPTGSFRVAARRGVIVAAGAVFTPLLLLQSGVRRRVGERFQAHPGAAVVGRFAEQVGMGFGATQAYEVPLHDQRLKIESIALPPELLAMRLPGAGAEWQRRLHHLDHYAQWAAVTHMAALGSVSRTLLGQPRVRYEPLAEDVEIVKRGVALLVRMMFAAGAEEVYPGVGRLPEVFTRPEQAELVLSPEIERRDFHLMASHHFGTACASADPHIGVVGPDLQSHDVEQLFVMDASVFPTNLGVNPQHSIMAVTFRAAEQLANREAQRARPAGGAARSPASAPPAEVGS